MRILGLCLVLLASVGCGGDYEFDYDDDYSSYDDSSECEWCDDSDGSNDDDTSRNDPPPPPPTPQVCVFQASSYMTCPGYTDSDPFEWRCYATSDLPSCKSMYDSDTSCSGGCCFRDTYISHQLVDGPCDDALARIEGGGSNDGGSDSGDATCQPSDAECVSSCLGAGYNAFIDECSNDGQTCTCTSQSCGSCVDTCLDAGYTGFSGICDPGVACYCSNDCAGCDDVCIQSGYEGFAGTCTSQTCHCR